MSLPPYTLYCCSNGLCWCSNYFVQYRKPTLVGVQMYFNSFGSLSAANMDFTIDLFLRQRWHDPRLAYTQGPPSYTIIDPRLQNKIWKPDTFFDNVKIAALHSVTMPNVLLRVSRSGHVLYSIRLKPLLL
ncbi:Neurotransmitter-gated ion-channel ligand-binding domain [Trinorchestia longiramus]|nr:Neurotransmitter-gated ion-channel ligand-binding domain [Trinorchestia longiramus]